MHRWEQGRAAKSKYPDPPEDIRAQLYALARNCKHPIADPPDPDPDPDPDQRQTPPNPRARANGREMAAPTLAEVLAEAGLRNYPPADAERFWHHFESSGWIDKNGHPIVKWQSKLATWVADSRARPAEAAHKNGTASVAQSILNEKELTRVEKQIDRIKGEYESHRDYTPGDKEKLANLTKRQRELKDALGFKA
jgi:hypothetical protein